jgi:hypothetical protein
MDLQKINTEVTHYDDSVECVLYDSTGEPEKDSAGQTVAVFVVSAYSSAARTQQQTAKTQLRRLNNRFGSWDKIPQGELDALDNQRIAACITSWRGFESDGKPFPLTPENAAAVMAGLRAKRPEQLAQIENTIAQHASFFQKPSAS